MIQIIEQEAKSLGSAAMRVVLALPLVVSILSGAVRAETNKACALLTPAELQALLGAKVTWLDSAAPSPGGATPTGEAEAQLCSGNTPTATILLRLAKKRGPATDAAAKGIEIAKKMGAQVDVKTFGPITCSTITPPKNLEQYGFNTTCSVDKGTEIAAVEVTAKTQKDMVSIDKLRPLAEKMATRF